MKTILLCLAVAAALPHHAAEKVYKDSRGKAIHFPLGDLSFADEVVAFDEGDPPARHASARDPKQALGPPNYDPKYRDRNFVSLGCGGKLTLKFTDNALVDVEGGDLYIFEIGPQVEAMHVDISRDGEKWVDVGTIGGGTAGADIAKYSEPGDVFRYVRITDLRSGCRSDYAGADIDAVGAIGGALSISLRSSVLFDTNESKLKPAAREELQKAAEQIRSMANANIVVEGHTDSAGSDEANRKLSVARAESVRDYFVREQKISASSIAAKGYGESRPIATNDTPEGREKNRRVEILVIPKE